LMACGDEFRNNGRADKTGSAGDEYAHGKSPMLCGDQYPLDSHPVKVVTLSWYNTQQDRHAL
jgi:hypothetical protein